MYSQLGQDLWVLESTNYKKNGYFIEIGAYDGIYHSNTYILERDYGWNGICVEPSLKYAELKINRSCNKDNLLVYSESNKTMDFHETIWNFELSGIPSCFNNDEHENNRRHCHKKTLQTISLTDLCTKHNAPNIIDYLSIDTEGSELKILENHDFFNYKFMLISVEHNRCSEYRSNISRLLMSHDYELDNGDRFTKINSDENTNFDDWYVYKGKDI